MFMKAIKNGVEVTLVFAGGRGIFCFLQGVKALLE